ncbi:hypothetical protein J3A83DRAFT_4374572 [Scleroderma citrinum]
MPLLDISMDATVGIWTMISTMVAAYQNPLQSNVDLMWLEDALDSKEAGIDSEQEACLILNYPPSGQGELLTCPTVVLGNGGTIALWYLPNASSHTTQVLPAVSAILSLIFAGYYIAITAAPAEAAGKQYSRLQLANMTMVVQFRR